MMHTRDRIHELVEKLPEDTLSAVEQFLERRNSTGGSPVRRALACAPVEVEPLTPEDIAALDEAYADVAAGRTVADAKVRRRLGSFDEKRKLDT